MRVVISSLLARNMSFTAAARSKFFMRCKAQSAPISLQLLQAGALAILREHLPPVTCSLLVVELAFRERSVRQLLHG